MSSSSSSSAVAVVYVNCPEIEHTADPVTLWVCVVWCLVSCRGVRIFVCMLFGALTVFCKGCIIDGYHKAWSAAADVVNKFEAELCVELCGVEGATHGAASLWHAVCMYLVLPSLPLTVMR